MPIWFTLWLAMLTIARIALRISQRRTSMCALDGGRRERVAYSSTILPRRSPMSQSLASANRSAGFLSFHFQVNDSYHSVRWSVKEFSMRRLTLMAFVVLGSSLVGFGQQKV